MSLHHLDLLFGFGGEANNPAIEYGINLFTSLTTRTTPLGKIPAYSDWEVWREGAAEGRLVGGWLPALGCLADTPYWPKVGNIVLFWEVIDSEIHDIDMILTTLRLKGVFEKVRGMLIGKTPGCEEREFAGLAPSIRELVTEITQPYSFPILANLDFGHVDENMPLPEGLLACMDTSDKSVSLLESFVLSDA
jgi:muramoyltetrapeptide carboxypeptidase